MRPPFFRGSTSLRALKLVRAALICAHAALAQAIELKWEVGNRFRTFDFFTPTRDSAASARMFERFAPRPEEKTTQEWLGRVIGAGGSPYSAERAGPWKEAPGQADPGYDKDLVQAPNSVLVRVSVAGTPSEMQAIAGRMCTWQVGDLPQHVLQPCDHALTIPAMPFAGAVIAVSSAPAIAPMTVSVKPRLRIVLGLGDSYGAGEGSPDVPTQWRAGLTETWWPHGDRYRVDGFVQKSASWWSIRCNRSFYSYQNMVALRMAADDPHSVVSFVHLACAGAEVVDGLLAPQRMPPGHPRGCKRAADRGSPGKVDIACDVPQSQLNAAVSLLCSAEPSKVSDALTAEIGKAIGPIKFAPEQKTWISDLVQCPADKIRPLDTVLLSIGGNDMGFAGVIIWALAPALPSQIVVWKTFVGPMIDQGRKSAGAVCPTGAPSAIACTGMSATERIKEIPLRMGGLELAMTSLLGVTPEQVIHTQYPNPLYDAKGKLCANPHRVNRNNEWYGARVVMPLGGAMQLNITNWEAGVIDRNVVPALNAAIGRSTERGWKSPHMNEAMARAGWCVGPDRTFKGPDQASSWNANASSGRFIRTSDDSVLTQWSTWSDDRNDGLSGTFHPNPQGYAAMADAVIPIARVEAVRRVSAAQRTR